MSGGGDFEAEGFINCENEINVLKVINYGKVRWTYSGSNDDISRAGSFAGIELAPRRYNQAISFFMLA